MTAAYEGHVAVVEFMLNHNAEVNLADKVGYFDVFSCLTSYSGRRYSACLCFQL